MGMFAKSETENFSTTSFSSPIETSKAVSESFTEALLPSTNACLGSQVYSEQDELPLTAFRGRKKVYLASSIYLEC